MSEKLRDRIISKGNGIFSASMNQLQSKLAGDIHDRAAAEYVKAHLECIAGIPDAFKGKVNQVTYSLNYILDGTTVEYAWNCEALNKSIIVPKIYGLYDESFGNSKILNIPKDFIVSQGIRDEVSVWRQAIHNTNAEQNKFMTELKRILKRTNTLKQFLDTWPQGENLVPPDVLAKLNEKPVREKKEPLITEEASVELSTTLLKRTLMS